MDVSFLGRLTEPWANKNPFRSLEQFNPNPDYKSPARDLSEEERKKAHTLSNQSRRGVGSRAFIILFPPPPQDSTFTKNVAEQETNNGLRLERVLGGNTEWKLNLA
jgi:hypothetical protein